MKFNYEDRYRISLPRRSNIIIRIDGKAFHTYTRGLQKPFDEGLVEDMALTTKFLCENIQGAKFGYVQSDEISILITDYDDLSTHAWFDNNLQKMCSISASLATAKFNQLRMMRKCWDGNDVDGYMDHDNIANFKIAMFDSRVFMIPDSEEVVNYFIWRQQDASRNSVSMAAQSLFSHKQLQGKSSSQMQEMMMTEKGVNWNDYPTKFRRGISVYKSVTPLEGKTPDGETTWTVRNFWKIDKEMPILTADRWHVKARIEAEITRALQFVEALPTEYKIKKSWIEIMNEPNEQ